MKKNVLCTMVLAVLVATSATTAKATNIHSNAIVDANPSSANPFTAGQTVSPNMSASGIGRGPGINPNAGGDRYNAIAWNTSALDVDDYFSWTLTPNAGFKIDFTALTGGWQRSGTGPNSYALRSSLDNYGSNITTGAITGTTFNLNLGASSFDSITSAVTFRFYAWAGTSASGTFSINDFIFDGTVSALAVGNNSIITAPGTDTFGRVILSQTPSLNLNLNKTGTDATTYTATPSNSGISVTADGSIAGGNQVEAISVQLQNNANGSAGTGSKAYEVTVENTVATSAADGQGSADPNDTINISATVVGNRTINATAVNLGNVIVGASTGGQDSTLSTIGDDDNNTRVTIDGTSATDGSVTVAAGTNQLFNDAGDSINRSVAGTFATAGAKSGSVGLSATGEGLAGEAVNSVAVSYTAAAFDPSTAAFASNSSNTLSIDFGTLVQNTGVQSLGDAIFNALQTAGFTAGLDFDFLGGSGDTSILYTDLSDGEFTGLAAGNAYSFLASFDTNTAPGLYSATYTLAFSDADIYSGASAAGSQVLTLELTGAIVPEPITVALAIPGLIGVIVSARRSNRNA